MLKTRKYLMQLQQKTRGTCTNVAHDLSSAEPRSKVKLSSR